MQPRCLTTPTDALESDCWEVAQSSCYARSDLAARRTATFRIAKLKEYIKLPGCYE